MHWLQTSRSRKIWQLLSKFSLICMSYQLINKNNNNNKNLIHISHFKESLALWNLKYLPLTYPKKTNKWTVDFLLEQPILCHQSAMIATPSIIVLLFKDSQLNAAKALELNSLMLLLLNRATKRWLTTGGWVECTNTLAINGASLSKKTS